MAMMQRFAFLVVCLFIFHTCNCKPCPKEIMSMKIYQKMTNQHLDELNKKMDSVLNILKQMQDSRVPTKTCDRDSCNGNGNCVSAADSTVVCECDEMYSGEYCEVFGPCHAAYQEFLHFPDTTHEPRCNDEGFFKPVQIGGNLAFCVDANGTTLGYAVNLMMANPENDCACAIAGKDEDCAEDGSYRQDYGYGDSFGYY